MLLALTAVFVCAGIAYASLTYGNGQYTNLCGTGFAATADTCNKGCSTSLGSCTSANPFVVKWTCDGRHNECRSHESAWTTSHSLSGTACGKTVQIDVFDKNCRASGGWDCQDSNLKDYMVWYSGDCPIATPTTTPKPTKTPTPTITPKPHKSSCDLLTVVSGNNGVVPATVTLRARGSDSSGSIQKYRFYFGDGQQTESANAEISHRYETSGSFRARVDIQDSTGAWKTSSSCQTTVVVRSLPVESHKSACSDLFITDGNYATAPVTATFEVTGFDNKGAIQMYKIENGLGNTLENTNGLFEQTYDKAGTYTVKGYIKDSEGVWKGGSASCQKTLYVKTAPLTSQPKTGTPTMYTVLSVLSGVIGISLLGVALNIKNAGV